jgi:hypothetical protein
VLLKTRTPPTSRKVVEISPTKLVPAKMETGDVELMDICPSVLNSVPLFKENASAAAGSVVNTPLGPT